MRNGRVIGRNYSLDDHRDGGPSGVWVYSGDVFMKKLLLIPICAILSIGGIALGYQTIPPRLEITKEPPVINNDVPNTTSVPETPTQQSIVTPPEQSPASQSPAPPVETPTEPAKFNPTTDTNPTIDTTPQTIYDSNGKPSTFTLSN